MGVRTGIGALSSPLSALTGRFACPYDRSVPGTIECRGPRPGQRLQGPVVINLHAQWELGKPRQFNRIPCPEIYGDDSEEDRLKWFVACLEKIARRRGPDAFTSVAFP